MDDRWANLEMIVTGFSDGFPMGCLWMLERFVSCGSRNDLVRVRCYIGNYGNVNDSALEIFVDLCASFPFSCDCICFPISSLESNTFLDDIL